MSLHDDYMPRGWHTIKSVLITEIATAANFHLCDRAATALFHARLIGESIARESTVEPDEGSALERAEET